MALWYRVSAFLVFKYVQNEMSILEYTFFF